MFRQSATSCTVMVGGGGQPYDTRPLKRTSGAPDYRDCRFPCEIIARAVRRYFRFALGYRDVEELLAERGGIVTYETIRRWCHKFGLNLGAE